MKRPKGTGLKAVRDVACCVKAPEGTRNMFLRDKEV